MLSSLRSWQQFVPSVILEPLLKVFAFHGILPSWTDNRISIIPLHRVAQGGNVKYSSQGALLGQFCERDAANCQMLLWPVKNKLRSLSLTWAGCWEASLALAFGVCKMSRFSWSSQHWYRPLCCCRILLFPQALLQRQWVDLAGVPHFPTHAVWVASSLNDHLRCRVPVVLLPLPWGFWPILSHFRERIWFYLFALLESNAIYLLPRENISLHHWLAVVSSVTFRN